MSTSPTDTAEPAPQADPIRPQDLLLGQEYKALTEKYGRAVGMNEVREATTCDSLWTFGLCGCTATLAFRADGRVQVAHFDPTQLAHHKALVTAFSPVRLYVLSPGEYRRDDEGDWRLIPKNPWNIGEVRVPYRMASSHREPLLARGLLYHQGSVTLPDRSFDYP